MQHTIKPKYKYDMVAEQLLIRIKDGEWSVGDKLPPESKLMEEFGVSRITLRESLKKLDMMGVLRIIQGDGTYVKEVVPSEFMKPLLPFMACNKSSIDEIYDARIFVEGGACKLLAEKRTDQDLRELEAQLNLMDQAISDCQYKSYSAYDQQFHGMLLKFSQNKVLETIVWMFQDIVSSYIQQINQDEDTIRKSENDHWQIFWAISDRDGELARKMMETHLDRSRKILLKNMQLENDEKTS